MPLDKNIISWLNNQILNLDMISRGKTFEKIKHWLCEGTNTIYLYINGNGKEVCRCKDCNIEFEK